MSTTWSFVWKRLRSIWTIPDLRNKILFTLGLLLVFRILAAITVPLTHQEQVNLVNLFGSTRSQNLGQLLGLLDVFSGGSLQTFSIVALGLAPYITATIVMQLLQPIIPALQNLSTQGEVGRLRLSQITRIVTVPLAFLQALGQSAIFVRVGVLDANTFSLFGQYFIGSNVKWLSSTALWISTYLANTSLWYYWLLYFAFVVAFTYFYAYIMWQQQRIPENLQKQGTFIPGYRPGEPTRKYLSTILTRITLGGALFLGIVAILPFVARVGGNQLLSSAALLIVVGVVLDTVRQLDAQMVMRNYSGFLS